MITDTTNHTRVWTFRQGVVGLPRGPESSPGRDREDSLTSLLQRDPSANTKPAERFSQLLRRFWSLRGYLGVRCTSARRRRSSPGMHTTAGPTGWVWVWGGGVLVPRSPAPLLLNCRFGRWRTNAPSLPVTGSTRARNGSPRAQGRAWGRQTGRQVPVPAGVWHKGHCATPDSRS